MTAIRFWLFGREFSLRCDPGQEERLHFLVNRLKERVEALSVTLPAAQRSVPAQMELLVMACITFADEFQDAREALSRLQDAFRPMQAAANGQHATHTSPPDHALTDLSNRQAALQARLGEMETRLTRLAEGFESD